MFVCVCMCGLGQMDKIIYFHSVLENKRKKKRKANQQINGKCKELWGFFFFGKMKSEVDKKKGKMFPFFIFDISPGFILIVKFDGTI